MMKRTCPVLVLLCVLSAHADNVSPQKLVDAGGDKAVFFEETTSPDGRYAIGWTIQPRNHAKPVDWSRWQPVNPEKFAWSYVSPLSDEEQNYELARCLIDLKSGSLTTLSPDLRRSDFPERAAGIVWSEPDHGRRCALIEFGNGAWTTNIAWSMELWLITIDATGIHQVNLVDSFYKALQPVLHEKRPLYAFAYEPAYLLQGGKITFTDSSARIAFKADDTELHFDSSAVEGTLTFRFSDGGVTNVSSDTVRDDPMQDVPELAEANRQLKEVCDELHRKGDWAEVSNTQTVWEDDVLLTGADAALRKALVDHSAHDALAARDKFFLETTQKRMTELEAKLDAIH
jgi:hypothetical protein